MGDRVSSNTLPIRLLFAPNLAKCGYCGLECDGGGGGVCTPRLYIAVHMRHSEFLEKTIASARVLSTLMYVSL